MQTTLRSIGFVVVASLLWTSSTSAATQRASAHAQGKKKASLVGTASWYGKQHQGKKMANGQRFDRRKMTAASWDFPLGTTLRVVNVKNGKFRCGNNYRSGPEPPAAPHPRFIRGRRHESRLRGQRIDPGISLSTDLFRDRTRRVPRLACRTAPANRHSRIHSQRCVECRYVKCGCRGTVTGSLAACYSLATGRRTAIARWASNGAPSSSCSQRTQQ